MREASRQKAGGHARAAGTPAVSGGTRRSAAEAGYCDAFSEPECTGDVIQRSSTYRPRTPARLHWLPGHHVGRVPLRAGWAVTRDDLVPRTQAAEYL